MTERPVIEDAPGLVWRERRGKWFATWQCRTDLVERGFIPKQVALWDGLEPTQMERDQIQFACQRNQSDMLLWSKGGAVKLNEHKGTLGTLIDAYQTHSHSSYRKLRYHVRRNHDDTLKRIRIQHGDTAISDIKGVLIMDWHKEWSKDGLRIPIAHAFISLLRTLCRFGNSILEDPECARVKGILSDMKFPQAPPREERLTADQVETVRAVSREHAWFSIALAQAYQFECTFRQMDCIGSWEPLSEPGLSDVTGPKGKWLRGIRWEEIDANLILRHVTSKKQKKITVDLKLAPMVLDELRFQFGLNEVGPPNRALLPERGPIIVSEVTNLPWSAMQFRRLWRKMADKAGVPKSVFNMDTRSGAISEATDLGLPLESVRHAATHSQVSQTANYSRGSEQKVAEVMKARSESRNKPKT